jgi:hypothetical protein
MSVCVALCCGLYCLVSAPCVCIFSTACETTQSQKKDVVFAGNVLQLFCPDNESNSCAPAQSTSCCVTAGYNRFCSTLANPTACTSLSPAPTKRCRRCWSRRRKPLNENVVRILCVEGRRARLSSLAWSADRGGQTANNTPMSHVFLS